mgnify:CR=1 FL=1
MTRLRTVAFGALAALWLAAPVPGHAQGIEIGPGGIRVDPGFDRSVPREVDRRDAIRIARGLGMSEVDSVSRIPGRWRIEGVDRRGRDMGVTISRRTGEVIDVDRGRS